MQIIKLIELRKPDTVSKIQIVERNELAVIGSAMNSLNCTANDVQCVMHVITQHNFIIIL